MAYYSMQTWALPTKFNENKNKNQAIVCNLELR